MSCTCVHSHIIARRSVSGGRKTTVTSHTPLVRISELHIRTSRFINDKTAAENNSTSPKLLLDVSERSVTSVRLAHTHTHMHTRSHVQTIFSERIFSKHAITDASDVGGDSTKMQARLPTDRNVVRTLPHRVISRELSVWLATTVTPLSLSDNFNGRTTMARLNSQFRFPCS